jgi:hypothetical protein
VARQAAANDAAPAGAGDPAEQIRDAAEDAPTGRRAPRTSGAALGIGLAEEVVEVLGDEEGGNGVHGMGPFEGV